MGWHRGEEGAGQGEGAGVRGGADQLGQPEGQGQRRHQGSRQHQDHTQQIPVRVPQLVCYQLLSILLCKLGQVSKQNLASHE